MSSTSPESAAPSPQGVLPSDFPAWLGPILVKELRQGLRTKTFVVCFIALQAALLFRLFLGIIFPDADGTEFLQILLWMGIAIVLCVLAPFRNFFVVSGEARARTLDLLLLTRQGPLRIVFGKWIALVAQVGLAIISILPYILAQYFVGGVNVISELVFLSHIVLLFCVLSAGTLAISTLHGVIGRYVCLVLAAIAGFFVMAVCFDYYDFEPDDWFTENQGLNGAGIGPGWIGFSVEVLLAALMTWFLLEFAAGRIAPPGWDRSVVRRILGLVLLAGLGGLMAWQYYLVNLSGTTSWRGGGYGDPVFPILLAGSVFTVWAADALTETIPPPNSQRHAGRLYIFGGGPDRGAVFIFLSILLAIGIVPLCSEISYPTALLSGIGIAVLAIVPAAVARCFMRKREREIFCPYVFTMAALTPLTLFTMMIMALAFELHTDWLDFPTLVFLALAVVTLLSLGLIIYFCRASVRNRGAATLPATSESHA